MSTLDTARVLYKDQALAVFPLAPNAKTPLAGSHSFKDARPLAEWKEWPTDANLAVATGMRSGGLVVIDLDGEVGKKSWAALVRRLGLRGLDTLTVITPRGKHLYFRSAIPFASNASVLAEGVDVRAEGGYVVGAGSVVKGLPYALIPGEILPLPAPLASKLTRTAPNLGDGGPAREGALEVDLLSGIKIVRDETGRPRAVIAR